MKQQKPVITDQLLGTNPLTARLVIPVRQTDDKTQYVRDGEGVVLPATFEQEQTGYVKFYTSATRRKLRNVLPLRSKEMVLWLMDEIEPGKDYIWINKERYMEEVGITSVTTYNEALKELIKGGFLAISLIKGVYWIHPDNFFRGNRLLKYPNKLVDHKTGVPVQVVHATPATAVAKPKPEAKFTFDKVNTDYE